jgi:glycosyltransferase involved in cell wall biosynthesis
MHNQGAPMQIDVVLLTKNSEHLLSRCLNSVYQNVPIKNLIVIDGYSTDRTQEILLRFNRKYGNVSIFQMHGSRAAARTEGIRRVSTDWFMFVDSDVLLCNGWFKKAHADMLEGVGMVWGLNVDVIPNIKNKRILTLQSIIARKAFNLRGGMHDTLILRKAVDGMRIPEHLHTYEDAYIVQYIASHGYKVVVGIDIYCLHYKPPSNWSLKNGLQQATGEVQNCLVYSHLYRYMLYYPVFFLYWCLQIPLNGFKMT